MTTPTTFKKQGLLSTGDIAKRFNVHRTTVWHWMNSGMLKSIRVTPRFRGVTEADLKAFQSIWIPDAPARVSPKRESSSANPVKGRQKASVKKKSKTKSPRSKSKA